MTASVFVFGTDLMHEGTGTVLDALQTRAGATDVILSATYHDARDVFPHNPRYRVYRHEGDIAWFHAQPELYEAGFAPKLAEAAEGADVLAGLCTAAQTRGMSVSAWVIFLHNSRLATARPNCATRNVYGDAYLSDLCPANPAVRRYCCDLTSDIARYPVARLLAESLHYRTLEHGEHHERYLIDLPGWARGLMSLCFCNHCRAAGDAAGIDTGALAQHIRDALEPVWQGRAPEAPPPELEGPAATMLERFEQVRRDIVTSLVADVRAALAPSGIALSFMDHAGALSHVLPGLEADADVIDAAGILGIDPAAVAANCDEYGVLGYTDTPERLARQLRRYRDTLGEGTRMSVALRPLAVDCRDADNLREKVAVARAAGSDAIAFYHYAMMPLDRLDWIGTALADGGQP